MTSRVRERLRARLERPPAPPFERRVWRSPIRGPWLASFLSLALLALFAISVVTGYFSYASYQPLLGMNSQTGAGPDLHLFAWTWPTNPQWLHALNQGAHVVAGIAVIPFLFAKLWAVMPKFFEWPPVRSAAQLAERGLLGLLVGSTIFLIFTGVWNIGYWYQAFAPFGLTGFSFIKAHYYAAFVFTGALAGHVLIKAPVMVRALRQRGVLRPLRDDLAHTRPEPPDEDTSAPSEPAPARISRRGFVAGVGVSSLALMLSVLGETTGGPLRDVALLAPRGRSPTTPPNSGPNGFQINETAARLGVAPRDLMAPRYRLQLQGRRALRLSRADLLRLPQHTYELSISCVEGWVTTETWTGVRLRDLARMAGISRPSEVLVESVQRGGAFGQATLDGLQVNDDRSLLALKVNGADLSIDHGFPARAIISAAPGVHNTKWVNRLTFKAS